MQGGLKCAGDYLSPGLLILKCIVLALQPGKVAMGELFVPCCPADAAQAQMN